MLKIYDEAKLKLLFSEGELYINTDDNHYKFWNIVQKDTKIVISWGRIGTKIRTKEKNFPNEWEARSYMFMKTAEKSKKGYKEI